ncbi:glutaredoxin family protein [Rathayibacter toxicus]|uniref:Glutaredoxin n=1 Tax=Rathayibacter toxicus TaxID=145458 RepID=A0A0C5BDS3_9MICO|nr:glutaredoxin domain-containing protein [Rathayibacter toxicus]AJM77104.1 glutaredoxin [Rathayibacter toxicus]ALS57064.1 glutaredoxin [Rathayibacter toxicus]KKM46111.1 glutaredoxin [Rathayibacter toxicus]PPG23063.1 glutaredoxin [Rathayibacter toxicus]PPG47645.1 glutaredoxin [Rathayibacter toxicus]
MITLYQRETCPFCAPVRKLLTDLTMSYLIVNVVKPREERRELIEATGTPFIPALVDGETIIPGRLEDNSHILTYLINTYGPVPDEAATSC